MSSTEDWLTANDTIQPKPIAEVLEVEQERDSEGKFTGKRLTRKQAAFVNEILQNPKQSATEAASKVYSVANRDVARSMAAENLAKPSIIMALGEHLDLAESVVVGTMTDWGRAEAPRKREIALDAAKYLHDKVMGKATQRVEQSTSVVHIAINLTGDNEQPPDDIIDLTTV